MTAERVRFLNAETAANTLYYIRSLLRLACLGWSGLLVARTRAQEAIVLFGYGTETLPVAFGDPGNK